MKKILAIVLIFALFSCSYSPILGPTDRYLSSSKEESQKDIDECTAQSEEYLKGVKQERALKEGARGAGWGSILGGIFGFLVGGDTKGLITGVAVGAGVGATTSAGSVLAGDVLTPDQIKQRFVSSCLARRGYEVIGWK